jgi:hypothetical protein
MPSAASAAFPASAISSRHPPFSLRDPLQSPGKEGGKVDIVGNGEPLLRAAQPLFTDAPVDLLVDAGVPLLPNELYETLRKMHPRVTRRHLQNLNYMYEALKTLKSSDVLGFFYDHKKDKPKVSLGGTGPSR